LKNFQQFYEIEKRISDKFSLVAAVTLRNQLSHEAGSNQFVEMAFGQDIQQIILNSM